MVRNPRSLWFLYFIVTPEAIKRYIIIFVFLGSSKEGEFGKKRNLNCSADSECLGIRL